MQVCEKAQANFNCCTGVPLKIRRGEDNAEDKDEKEDQHPHNEQDGALEHGYMYTPILNTDISSKVKPTENQAKEDAERSCIPKRPTQPFHQN